jgi:GrpB-like predicted nucleotidyltransferase (UPF0157 family)
MKVEIVDYNPAWPAFYEREKNLILNACGDKVYSIEHIGSTSVPGLGAKPIIDILLGVKVIEDADEIIPSMQSLGYTYKSDFENVMPYRRYFSKPDSYHVHTVEITGEFWKRHLLFRDYLRTHDNVRDDYYKLKTGLAVRDWNDRNDYAYAKTDYVMDIENKAHEYFSKR